MRQHTFTNVLFFLFACSTAGFADEANVSNESTQIADFEGLVGLLNRDGVVHKTDLQNQSVTIPTEKGTIDGVLVIRWDTQQSIVHFIQPLMMTIPNDKFDAMESAMMRLNHGMPYPGLGINHKMNGGYFRMSVPLVNNRGLTDREVRAYFSNTLAEAAKWRPELKKVLEGTTVPDRIVEAYRDSQFPTGSFTTKVIGSTWTLNFDGKDSLTLTRDGKEVVQSTYEVRGDRIRFVDRGGPMSTDSPGVYAWKHEGDKLQFKPVNDESDGRKKVLGDAPWLTAATKPSQQWRTD